MSYDTPPATGPPDQHPRKSWPARHKIWTALGAAFSLIVVLVIVGAATASPQTKPTGSTATATSPSPTAAPAATTTKAPPAASGPLPCHAAMRSLLSARLTALTRLNPMRVDLVERFEKLVADYNAGSVNTEAFFQELLKFSDALDQEEARSLSEGLTEEQLAVFDILMRPAPELTEAEKAQVKTVAEDLLVTLKRGKIVLDWRKEQNTRAAVRVAVEETLDRLPEKFTRQIYAQKCDAIYQHVFDSYWDDGHTVLRQGRMNPISCTPEGTPH